MNRLTDIYLGNTHSQIVYDPLGRMTDKEADGQTVFANAGFTAAPGQPTRPHAMTGAETTEDTFPAADQSIVYTSFDKVKTIVEDDNYIIYTYGYDQQRIHLTESVDGVMRLKEYVGVCEFITDDFANTPSLRSLTYLVGPYGVFAAVEKQGSTETIHYILKDHLGSWTTITDAEGVVEQELSFDAWGGLRDPVTWSGGFSDPLMFDRGFTGHEHLYAFGLINMNGRMYDPQMSSFLSVDAYVQSPENAQGFNRYAYCMHNPLRYTDPSGWRKQGREPSSGNYEHWSMRYAMPVYEPRDYQNPYYLYNQSFFGNYEGIMSEGGGSFGGGGAASYGFENSYGYYVTHLTNGLYNYCFASTQLQLILNWKKFDYRMNSGRDINVYAKSSLDIVMGLVGLWSPIGFGISLAYFVTDLATDGFNGWGQITY